MAHLLAILVGFSGFVLYMAAFFFPEVHRKNDFIWSGIILFYALALWVYSGRITGGVLLSQVASVLILGWLGWQTLVMRRQLTPYDQQTWVSGSGKSVGEVLFLNAAQLGSQLQQRWEQLPLPAPLRALPGQLGQTVGNLRTRPQPKAAPPVKPQPSETTQTAPRKVKKKPKPATETPTETAETPASAVPSTAPLEAATQAIAPTPPPVTDAPPETAEVTASAPAIPETIANEVEAIAPTPPPVTDAPPETETVEVTAAAPATSETTAKGDEAIAPPITDVPVPIQEPAPAETVETVEAAEGAEAIAPTHPAETPDTVAPPDTTAPPSVNLADDTAEEVTFTPPPGTEPTAVAHVSEVSPEETAIAPPAAADLETAAPSPGKPLQEDSPTIPDTPPTSSADASPVETPAEETPAQAEAPEEPVLKEPDSPKQAAEPAASTLSSTETEVQEPVPSSAPPLAVAPSDAENAGAEWEALEQDFWGEPEEQPSTGEPSSGENQPENLPPASASAPRRQPLTRKARATEEEGGRVREEMGRRSRRSRQPERAEDEWDTEWNEPPAVPTPIQPPPVQPIVEPEELSFAEMVAAANRALSPEERIVVDVSAVEIKDEPGRFPPNPSQDWNDWDEEDNNNWFDD